MAGAIGDVNADNAHVDDASGRTVTSTGMQIDRIESGRTAENRVDLDMYRQFREPGLLGQAASSHAGLPLRNGLGSALPAYW